MQNTIDTINALFDEWAKAQKKANKAREARTEYVLKGDCDPVKLALLVAKADAAREFSNSVFNAYLEESAKISIDR